MSDTLVTSLKDQGIIQDYSLSNSHVIYEGGRIHSNFSFNINQFLSKPEIVQKSIKELLCRIPDIESTDLVCSYLPYGDQLAAAVGGVLGKEALTLDTSSEQWLPRAPIAGEKSLIIADDILTGGRVEKLVAAILARDATYLKPVLVLANLSTNWSPPFPVSSLVDRKIPLWSSQECPLCKAGSIPRRRVDLMMGVSRD